MRIFLTGGSGYIGGALARRLVGEGHDVRALVRPTSVTTALEELEVACFAGDVTDRYSMREAMSGADWVIHAAAVIDFAADPSRMRAVNVGGSDNVASLAFKLGTGRLLSISSMAAFGGSPADGSPGDEESAPLAPLPGAYSASKNAGEGAIRAWESRGLKVNTVYPSLVYGPPGKRRGANALLRNVALGRMPVMVGGDRLTRWVHIDDLVEGILRVMERAEPGAAYLLTGDLARVRELIARVCELADARAPRIELPVAVARALAGVAAAAYRLRGRRSPLAPDEVRSLSRHWNFDDAKARHDLGWRPRTLEEGLPETLEHLLAR